MVNLCLYYCCLGLFEDGDEHVDDDGDGDDEGDRSSSDEENIVVNKSSSIFLFRLFLRVFSALSPLSMKFLSLATSDFFTGFIKNSSAPSSRQL